VHVPTLQPQVDLFSVAVTWLWKEGTVREGGARETPIWEVKEELKLRRFEVGVEEIETWCIICTL